MAGLRLHLQRLDNGTYFVTFIQGSNNSETGQALEEFINPPKPPYDDRGALYYVVAVLLIYGLSIILMISSSVRKGKKDNGFNNYMKDIDKIRQLERRQQKFKTRLVMQKNELRSVSSSNRDIDATTTTPKAYDYINTKHMDDDSSKRATSSNIGTNWNNSKGLLLTTGRNEDFPQKSADSDRLCERHTIDSYDLQISSHGNTIECDVELHVNVDKSLMPESSPYLAVLQEKEDEIEDQRAVHTEEKDRHVIINIDNIEQELVASFV